jgi:hypothetical protein
MMHAEAEHKRVIFAVQYKRWHIDLFELLGEIGLGEGLDAS